MLPGPEPTMLPNPDCLTPEQFHEILQLHYYAFSPDIKRVCMYEEGCWQTGRRDSKRTDLPDNKYIEFCHRRLTVPLTLPPHSSRRPTQNWLQANNIGIGRSSFIRPMRIRSDDAIYFTSEKLDVFDAAFDLCNAVCGGDDDAQNVIVRMELTRFAVPEIFMTGGMAVPEPLLHCPLTHIYVVMGERQPDNTGPWVLVPWETGSVYWTSDKGFRSLWKDARGEMNATL